MQDMREQFEREIAEHQMTIIKEDGVYRHIRFGKPGTACYHFNLITWPGYLCFTGDMGTFVFTRTEDMFEFFRRPEHCRYSIDMRYWAEKLVATNCYGESGGAAREFDPEKFRKVVNEYRVRWIRQAKEYGALDKEQRRELWEAVEDDVLRQLEDGEYAATTAAYQFHWQAGPNHPAYQFDDIFEYSFTQYTHTFKWCCLALNWAIQVHDKTKEEEYVPTTPT